ncbi:hypothetical protein SLEP1_g50384 [Rubroshorea leprosula]|uniref:Uncharacterized protein n=1 Tax=Rubroshorea leprosula TaxID=152421 RepID=A0AAV5LZV1_9ROSI|nr:hypothetical protein SLEP1_g50384 [Rubroshorea leprosula]
MSGGPINSARSRSTLGRRGRHNSVDLACDVTPVLDAGHTRSISPQGSIHAAASSHNGKQKGRGPNKPKRAARRADERPLIQISHKGTFLDVEDERDKWRANGEYRPVWVPEHLWPALCSYWDSAKFHNLSERGKKNKAFGERVTHTTGSTKAAGGLRLAHQELYKETRTLRKGVPQGQEAPWCGDKHKTRHDTYISECSATYGSDSASWPPRDNDAWATVVGGCHSNFMPGIGSQASLSQQFVAFSAYGMRPPTATPSLPHTGQACPPVGASFPTVGPSFHASGPSFPHAMPMQMPIEPTLPMGQMGRQLGSPGTSSANPPQDDYGYQLRFDVDYQGPFGSE